MKRAIFTITVASFILFLLMSGSCFASPALPFYCTGEIMQTAEMTNFADLESVESGDIVMRSDIEALEYYLSMEYVSVLFDNGETILATSESGYYLGHVVDEKRVKIDTILTIPHGIKGSSSGRVCASVYQSDCGFWIYSDDMILLLDLNENKYYYQNFTAEWLSENDRFFACRLKSSGELAVIDRDTGAVQLMPGGRIDFVPYFDESGIAILASNSKDEYYNRKSLYTYYLNTVYRYYSWESGCIYEIKDYSDTPIVYIDANILLVEKEFSFDALTSEGTAWKLSKADLLGKDSSGYTKKGLPMQFEHFWQFGPSSEYSHTYIISEEEAVKFEKKLPDIYFYSHTGRFMSIPKYTLVYDLVKQDSCNMGDMYAYFESPAIICQDHFIWPKIFDKDIAGDYTVYSLIDEVSYRRTIFYGDYDTAYNDKLAGKKVEVESKYYLYPEDPCVGTRYVCYGGYGILTGRVSRHFDKTYYELQALDLETSIALQKVIDSNPQCTFWMNASNLKESN